MDRRVRHRARRFGHAAKKATAKVQQKIELCKFSRKKITFLHNYLHFSFVFSIFACQNKVQNRNETQNSRSQHTARMPVRIC